MAYELSLVVNFVCTSTNKERGHKENLCTVLHILIRASLVVSLNQYNVIYEHPVLYLCLHESISVLCRRHIYGDNNNKRNNNKRNNNNDIKNGVGEHWRECLWFVFGFLCVVERRTEHSASISIHRNF
jgi:hypothetical protein